MRSALHALAAALLVALPGAAFAQSAPELQLVRVGAAPDEQSKPVLYAKQAGLFEKVGLNVQVTALAGGGAAIAAAVIGGSLDMGKSNTLQLIVAHTKNLPFTIVAAGAVTGAADRGAALLVGVNSPLRTARDLNGKTLGVTSLVTIEIIADKAYIDANGGDSSTVHFVEVPPSATVAAIEQGRVDGATILEPALSAALASGKIRTLGYPYGAIATRFEGADWFTTLDYAAKHRDVVEKFARVMRDANAYVTAHETETIPLIAAYTGIDAATLAGMQHPERPPYPSAAVLQPLIDMAAKYKFIAKPFPAQELISEYALKAPR